MLSALSVRGEEVPRIGFGTSGLEGRDGYSAIRSAIEVGYRHIDTASSYHNEELVGRAVKEARVDREEMFLATKIGFDLLSLGGVIDALRASLRRLDTDYVDLAYIHWPSDEVPLSETLQGLERAAELGLCRRFGVSNFTPALMREALSLSRPLALQVEYHPFLDQSELLQICRDNDMMLTAYCPLMRGQLLDDPVLSSVAEAHGASVSQIALAYLLRDPHVSVIPKSTDRQHMLSNLRAPRHVLTGEEVRRIDALPKDRRLVRPDWAPAEWAQSGGR